MVTTSSAAFIGYPAFSRVRVSNDLLERAVAIGTEVPDVSAENDVLSQGLSSVSAGGI